MNRKHVLGAAAGAIAATVDVIAIAAVDGGLGLVGLQAALFWLVAGWLVVLADTGLGAISHALIVTHALAAPWVLAEVGAGRPDHVVPMLVMNTVFAFGFAFAHSRARR
ncbi:MAG: hypothetical protein R3B48_28235 [Kofleriaceae bacterium]